MPSTPGGQLGSQDDGPSAGSHRIGRGVPLHKPEIQPLVHTGWRRAHQGSFPEFLRAITASYKFPPSSRGMSHALPLRMP